MDIDILNGPGCATAKVKLAPGEVVTAEGGSMITMSGDMSIETTTHQKGKRGILKALKRMVSGEGLFLNHYTAGNSGGEVLLSTTLLGDMMTYQLNNESVIVQSGSYVASEQGVEIDFGWQGFKSLLSGEKSFWLDINGSGKVVVNSFGAIYPIEVDGAYIVDTGHIVAFQKSLDFSITKAGKSWFSSIIGGEGLVCKFQGKGTVWCQSHNSTGFGMKVGSNLKPR